jgi:hypothetical protein
VLAVRRHRAICTSNSPEPAGEGGSRRRRRARRTGDDGAEVVAGSSLLYTSAKQSGDGSAIDAVLAFVRQQRADLRQLLADRPQAEAPMHTSLDLLGQVESRGKLLGAALLGTCTATTFDRLGPRPNCS